MRPYSTSRAQFLTNFSKRRQDAKGSGQVVTLRIQHLQPLMDPSLRNEMLEPSVRRKAPGLNGMVLCGTCDVAMRDDAGEFSCGGTGDGKCRTPSIGTDALLVRVMTVLVDRMVSSGAVDRVVEKVRRSAESASKEQISRLNASEYEIATLNRAKLEILREVEEGVRNYSESLDRVNEINNTVAGLAYESMVARGEWDRAEFIGDKEGLQEAARDLRTYLESSTPDLVQELLELMVKEIQVRDGEAVIFYKESVPTKEPPIGVLVDRIPLD